MIYKQILNCLNKRKLLSVLIDPDEYDNRSLIKTIELANHARIDFFFVGGSLVSTFHKFEYSIKLIKENSDIPVIIFPGSILQVSGKADGILLLSLISGRNPDYLIGNHVQSAFAIKNTNLEVLPTGYILIENGHTTSVEYISNTKPIPAGKHDIATATAIAGELMGNKLIYLEAGSGAANTVGCGLIQKIKQNISIPLIVGGGIKTKEQLNKIYNAGADIVVIGNAIEQQPDLIGELVLWERE